MPHSPKLNIAHAIVGAAFAASLATSGASWAGQASSGKAFKPHWVSGVFVGGTDNKYGTHETSGIEAAYRATKRFSVGPIVEHLPDAGDGFQATMVLGTAHLHATKNIRLIGGGGREYHHGDEFSVWRAGAAYDFHIRHMHISPTVNMDVVDNNQNFVFGVTFARAFTR